MGKHPSYTVFLISSLDTQETFTSETLGSTVANILMVQFGSQYKLRLNGPPQPGPWGRDECVASSCSPGATFLLRTKSNVRSFALLCLNPGAEKDELAGPLGSLLQLPGVFSEPLTSAGLQSGMNFLPVLGCLQ